MSTVIAIAPILIASWPILTTAACSAANAIGFSIVKESKGDKSLPKSEEVLMPIEDSEVLKEQLKEHKSLTFAKGETTITFSANDRGKCSLRVCGGKYTKQQLRQIGQDMMNRVTQQYVYNKVVTELKHQGYSVVTEEMKENKAVRVVVRRFS